LLGADWRFGLACKHLVYAFLFFWLVDRAAEGFGGVGGWLLQARPMIYLGGISYGIYLYHEFVPALAGVIEQQLHLPLHFPEQRGAMRLLCVLAGTLPLAALSWHAFEKPLNRLKSHFPYLRKERRSPETAA
jgi:peptidoglycan/LPS O-acetylase OafA/YrhL